MRVFTLLLFLSLAARTSSYAQWLDSSNQFKDSLHMPVTLAANDQLRAITVKGDNGSYFILWQDSRNAATNKTDIYAQKYDQNGKVLWSMDGLPVASGTNNELFGSPQNADYRRAGIAAPDGAGGLYVCWNYDIQIGSYDYWGVAIQHLKADGTRVFGNEGLGIGMPTTSDLSQYENPQLVTDDHGGFFIAYQKLFRNNIDLYAYCYKDEGGSLKLYGGGQMDQYGKELISNTACGVKYDVSYDFDAQVTGFNLYPDQQGGCNIAMVLATNSQELWTAYNRLCRVKKDCHTTVRRRGLNSDDPGTSYTFTADYKKDSVVRLYNFKTYMYQTTCRPQNDPNSIVTYTNTRIENNGMGYLPLATDSKYDIDYPQGVLLQTGGNINAEIISTSERALDGKGGVTPYHIHGYYRLNEIYDSIPYELCTDLDHPYQAYRPTLPDNAIPTDTLLAGPDTLIGRPSSYLENYTLAGSGNKAWVAGKGFATGGPTNIYLQELKLVSAGTKKFTFATNTTDKSGLIIGQEIRTGFTGTEIYYNTPAIATDNNGHALLYIMESTRFARVSPIADGGILSWGAMGRPVGTGYWAGYPLDCNNPMALLSENGEGIIAWTSGRYSGTPSGYNIWMERVSDVFTPNYLPPLQTLSITGTNTGESIPAYFTGGTNTWTTITTEVYNGGTGTGYTTVTPVVSILDNYALGFVKVKTYENTISTLRVAKGAPYLDRNFTITVDNNPNGTGSIPIRFYIPQPQFDALKTAIPGIRDPGDLSVIDQPNTTGTLATAYTPNGTETILPITNWSAIAGGYYIEFVAKGFSNFFIAQGATPLPLQWLDVKGRLTTPTTAAIAWTVTEEKDVRDYTVEYSSDGIHYTDGCTTGSSNTGTTTSYHCSVRLPATGTYSFRVRQTDLDGKFTYSKVVVLTSVVSAIYSISPNPTASFAVLRIPNGTVVTKLRLLDLNGRAVWQSAGALNGDVTIPMGQLSAGVYHLQVAENNDTHVLKIVKK